MTDITSFYKGETVQVYVLAKNADGTALSNPNGQIIIFNIATTISGNPMITLDDRFVVSLANLTVSKYLVTIPASDLVDVIEGKKYYYNIWSKNGSDDPRLQVSGMISLARSII